MIIKIMLSLITILQTEMENYKLISTECNRNILLQPGRYADWLSNTLHYDLVVDTHFEVRRYPHTIFMEY